jgi:hypothetical protein
MANRTDKDARNIKGTNPQVRLCWVHLEPLHLICQGAI